MPKTLSPKSKFVLIQRAPIIR